jgi:hypothetical protein
MFPIMRSKALAQTLSSAYKKKKNSLPDTLPSSLANDFTFSQTHLYQT